MYEIEAVRQDDVCLKFRWFTTMDCDLYLWENPHTSEIERFQFCFDKDFDEKIVEWQSGSGSITHAEIDGNGGGRFRGSATFKRAADLDLSYVFHLFQEKAQGLDKQIWRFVAKRLRERIPRR
ncbi:MAG: hypothetical protein AAFP70_14150 [Calditrichota bacterium]